MSRIVGFGFCLLLSGCQLPPERLPLRPLSDETPPLPYAELLTRARLQATTATEAFYVNQWGDLEDSARGLEQTARFLGKAIEVPASRAETLAKDAEGLTLEAGQLRKAAQLKDDKQTNEILQRIHLKVRQLRPEG